MKKFISKIWMFVLVLFVLALIAVPKVCADDFTINLTTFNVASGGDFALGAYPNISGGAKIQRISLSNDGDVQQLVQMYTTATSTSAASLLWQVVLASGSVSVPAREFTFPWTNSLIGTNIAVKKSQTGSNVYMNINYK